MQPETSPVTAKLTQNSFAERMFALRATSNEAFDIERDKRLLVRRAQYA